eukprot:3871459-Pyramimonas_sp.AAC.2
MAMDPDKHDEDLYDYYAKSRLVMVSVSTGEVRLLTHTTHTHTHAHTSKNCALGSSTAHSYLVFSTSCESDFGALDTFTCSALDLEQAVATSPFTPKCEMHDSEIVKETFFYNAGGADRRRRAPHLHSCFTLARWQVPASGVSGAP